VRTVAVFLVALVASAWLLRALWLEALARARRLP
jgi:hypothetical protein